MWRYLLQGDAREALRETYGDRLLSQLIVVNFFELVRIVRPHVRLFMPEPQKLKYFDED